MVTLETSALGCPIFNPLTHEVWEDPYSVYNRMRTENPVAWTEPPSGWQLLLSGGITSTSGFWFLSRYGDVVAGLMDPRLGHEVGRRTMLDVLSPTSALPEPIIEMINKWILFKDPPDHMRMRRHIGRALANLPYLDLESRTTEIVTALLDAICYRSRIDIIQDFASLLPMRVISELLGVPSGDQPRLTEWSQALYDALELGPQDNNLRTVNEIVQAAQDYFRFLAQGRRGANRGELCKALLETQGADQGLSEDEFLATCVLMLFAGQDTTFNLIGTATLALLYHPEHLVRLRNEPSIEHAALQEFLRYDSPQQLAFRYAIEDLVLGGTPITKGQLVCLGIGSANRDPSVFPEPDHLNFDRPNNRHIAFGRGIHACPGSRLGLVMVKVAMRFLIAHLSHMRLRRFAWEENAIMRGLKELEVELVTA